MWLQHDQNSLACVVCAVPFHSSSAQLLHSLHWLPVRHRITHKVATLTFKALLHHQPTCLYQMLNTYCPTHWLQSSGAGLLVKPETSNKTSDRAFVITAVGLTTWNQLLQKIRMATTTEQLSRILKTRLFILD